MIAILQECLLIVTSVFSRDLLFGSKSSLDMRMILWNLLQRIHINCGLTSTLHFDGIVIYLL